MRIIFHIDVNSAFLSWSAIKIMEEGGEDIRLVPSAVGGDRDKRTGIITAKSIPAKKYGITTGEPVSMALRKCPNLILVKGDFAQYKKCSKAFMDICRKYTPTLQVFSIDECFLDMSGTDDIYSDYMALAHKIKDEIKNTLGFTVNVGIGSNKLLAKMASDFEKPDRVHTLFDNEVKQKLWPLPVGDLIFVGKKSAQILTRAGIMTIGDLAQCDLKVVQMLLGEKSGQQAWEYARGIDDSPVTAIHEDPKGYSVSTTLEEDVTTMEQAKGILLALCDSVATRMRADNAKAFCVHVDIRYSKIADINGLTASSRFTNKSHQRSLENATDVTDEIYKTCVELLSEFWHQEPLRLMGVALSNLTKDDYEQFSLFQDESREKSKKMDALTDTLRNKFGTDVIFRGGAANTHHVGMKFKK